MNRIIARHPAGTFSTSTRIASTRRASRHNRIAASGASTRGSRTSSSAAFHMPRDEPEGGIQYAVAPTSLGWLAMRESRNGVCAVMFSDEATALEEMLEVQSGGFLSGGADVVLESRLAQLVDFVESPRCELELPLDLRGTEFQREVWRELQKIPLGRTATYTEIARRVGAPKAIRAVGSACAANPIALLIPCHRVVRSDGSLSSYRWGTERKRLLLEREARDEPGP